MPGSRASRAAVAAPIPVDAPVTTAHAHRRNRIRPSVARMGAMQAASQRRAPRLAATLREGERVTPLELFFDLVFVLAITQCTALMADDPTWSGLAQGLLVLGVLWWAWVGYAWLTSVIDPEEGAVRLVDVRGDGGDADRRASASPRPSTASRSPSPSPTAPSASLTSLSSCSPAPTTPPCGTPCSASPSAPPSASACSRAPRSSTGSPRARSGRSRSSSTWPAPTSSTARAGSWSPGHFAERHGLIVIIALGESIVAIGIGAAGALNLGIGAAAVLGVALAAAQWWIYFDVVALISARRLGEAEAGRAQNELARDSYSYIHLLMVAGVVLVALGHEDGDRPSRRTPRRPSRPSPCWAASRLPARPGRLPLPPRPHDQPPAPRPGDGAG